VKIKKTIKVTQKHIEEGQPENCTKCAVALAVKEQFPDFVPSIHVIYDEDDYNHYGIDLHNLDGNFKTKFSKYKTVNIFIDKFDRDFKSTELKPFEFELTAYKV